jgi:hypothetical protein
LGSVERHPKLRPEDVQGRIETGVGRRGGRELFVAALTFRARNAAEA